MSLALPTQHSPASPRRACRRCAAAPCVARAPRSLAVPALTPPAPRAGGSQRVRGPGKAHKSGLGAGVMRRVNGGDRASSSGRGMIGQYSHLFTTDLGDGRAANMQSVLDVSDLDEMMAMADLAGRSFAAERQNVVIVSMCAPRLPGSRAANCGAAARVRVALGLTRLLAVAGVALARRRRWQLARRRGEPPLRLRRVA